MVRNGSHSFREGGVIKYYHEGGMHLCCHGYQGSNLISQNTLIPCMMALHCRVLSDFINLTQVHNFTVSAQDIFTFRRLSVFTVSFTRILRLVMEIMKRFALYYRLVKWLWCRIYNQKVLSSNPRKFFFIFFFYYILYLIRLTSLL